MSLIEFQDYPSNETPLNAENLNHNFNELKESLEWKLFAQDKNINVDVTLPDGFNELCVEIKLGHANVTSGEEDRINIIICKSQLSELNKVFRAGFYFNNAYNGAVVVKCNLNTIRFNDAYFGGSAVHSYSSMSVYYR